MATVYLIGGEKGGTGKSFVCRTLIQYFVDAKIPFAAVDADSTNPDVKDIYSKLVTEVRFSEDDFKNNPYDIYTLAIEKPVIVNLPAGVYEPLKDWIVTADIASSAQADGVSFCHFLVSSGMYDSLVPCIKVLETMGSVMPHIFVKNRGAGRDWEFYKTFSPFKELVEKYGVKEMEFPDLQAPAVNRILQSRMTYAQYLESPKTAAGIKPLVRGFLRKAYAAFQETGLMPPANSKLDVLGLDVAGESLEVAGESPEVAGESLEVAGESPEVAEESLPKEATEEAIDSNGKGKRKRIAANK